MPKLRPVRERLAQPVLDTLQMRERCVRLEQPKCICVWPNYNPKCPAPFDVNSDWAPPSELPLAIVKLPRFGLRARAKRSYGDWRRRRLERRKASLFVTSVMRDARIATNPQRARELQMLKELEHSSESAARSFWQVIYAVGTFLSGTLPTFGGDDE